MLIVVAYDIVDDKRRRELHDLLKDFGSPRQKSLFECDLDGGKIVRLRWAVKGIIEPGEDSVRCYFICPKCEKKLPTGTVVLGGREPVII